MGIESSGGGESIEREKIALAEKIISHYWDEPEPFRKLAEHKRTLPGVPTGDQAWHLLKIYIWFSSESMMPSENQVAKQVGLPLKQVQSLFNLARKEARVDYKQ